jgi:hypothetical protein
MPTILAESKSRDGSSRARDLHTTTESCHAREAHFEKANVDNTQTIPTSSPRVVGRYVHPQVEDQPPRAHSDTFDGTNRWCARCVIILRREYTPPGRETQACVHDMEDKAQIGIPRAGDFKSQTSYGTANLKNSKRNFFKSGVGGLERGIWWDARVR